MPDGAAARGRLLSSLDAGVEACECTEAWARRVERAGAAGSEGGASRLWRRRSHFPLRPPLHFGRPCRRHVMCSPGPPLLSRLRSRGPCAWARGLSPIGGRRLRGGSLVIGRRRGGRGPGTLLVTPAPAWGGDEGIGGCWDARCSGSGGRATIPLMPAWRGDTGMKPEALRRKRVVAWRVACKGEGALLIPEAHGQLQDGACEPLVCKHGTGVTEEVSSRSRGARLGN